MQNKEIVTISGDFEIFNTKTNSFVDLGQNKVEFVVTERPTDLALKITVKPLDVKLQETYQDVYDDENGFWVGNSKVKLAQ